MILYIITTIYGISNLNHVIRRKTTYQGYTYFTIMYLRNSQCRNKKMYFCVNIKLVYNYTYIYIYIYMYNLYLYRHEGHN